MDEGFMYASCAMSFFRNRHVPKPLYKKSRRHAGKTVSQFRESVRMARHYIGLARAAGFRGSVTARIREGEHLR